MEAQGRSLSLESPYITINRDEDHTGGYLVVMDMSKVEKIKSKRTKSGTGMKRFHEIKSKGKFISNLIPLIPYPK
nr:hypothetical protein [Tanacetum cinerariifolium]